MRHKNCCRAAPWNDKKAEALRKRLRRERRKGKPDFGAAVGRLTDRADVEYVR